VTAGARPETGAGSTTTMKTTNVGGRGRSVYRHPVRYPDDDGLIAVLTHLDVAPTELLGHGGEAWVYALDEHRVVRVLHEGGSLEQIQRNRALVEELDAGSQGLAMPEVVDVGTWVGRQYTVERRLPGRSLLDALDDVRGVVRDQLIEAHLETAHELGGRTLRPRDYVGDLAEAAPVRTSTWRQYLERKAAAALQAGGLAITTDASSLAAALPEPERLGFVHLDAFAGNMMTDGRKITGILDVGPCCVRGDTRFNVLGAVVYLESPETTPGATRRDIQLAHRWLADHELGELLEPARAWLAAYWSFEADNPKLLAWIRSVLGPFPAV
jgi:aminoglycoside phosphotransferase